MRHSLLLVTVCCFCALPALGATYFISSSGLDSNSGTTSGTPWLTPNHALNCGDVIQAAAGTYVYTNFQQGDWGTVTCAAGNNVAWLTCTTFDTCKILTTGATNYPGMWMDKSYWGVQGWEITVPSGTYPGCWTISPDQSGGAQIHHIIVANSIANGCQDGGIGITNEGTASVDYVAFVGDIAYNSAHGSGVCGSGLNIYQPVQSDSFPGTHIFIAGSFSWANVDGDPCNGTAPTDGEGILLDTLNGSQGGFATPYAAQVVVENNVVFQNGGSGIEVGGGTAGSSNTMAHIFFLHNTIYGNLTDPNLPNYNYCGDLTLSGTRLTEAAFNLVVTPSTTGCGSSATIYSVSVVNGDNTDHVYSNWAYSVPGNNSATYGSGSFAFGPNNTFGTNPRLANPGNPGAPSCGGYSSVPGCMAAVIANFSPLNAAASTYGYQAPLSYSISDPLFPQWLCNVNLPAGLVTMGCVQLHLTVRVS